MKIKVVFFIMDKERLRFRGYPLENCGGSIIYETLTLAVTCSNEAQRSMTRASLTKEIQSWSSFYLPSSIVRLIEPVIMD